MPSTLKPLQEFDFYKDDPLAAQPSPEKFDFKPQ